MTKVHINRIIFSPASNAHHNYIQKSDDLRSATEIGIN